MVHQQKPKQKHKNPNSFCFYTVGRMKFEDFRNTTYSILEYTFQILQTADVPVKEI